MDNLNTWYSSNLKNYEQQYIDTSAGFCSDRNMASGYSWSSSTVYYAAYDRRNGSASLQCNSEDILSKDNGKLTNPIGLVTSDEAVLTGIGGTANPESYLYTEQTYWTMSPSYFNISYAHVFFVNYNGYLGNGDWINSPFGVRPVINLHADVQLTGSGTTSDPFKVVGAS